MKVCIVNSDFGIGGQQKATIDLAEQLISQGNEVELYSFYPKNIFYKEISVNIEVDHTKDDLSVFSKLKRKIERKYIYNKENANPSKEFSKRLKNMTIFFVEKQIDVVILSGGFQTAFSYEIKKQLPKLKIIAWQHSTAEIYLEKYFKPIKKNYIRGLESSDCIVCLTEHDKITFSQYNKNVHTIGNMLSIKSLDETKTNLNRIVFVSRYDIHTKGIDLLFSVLSKLPNEVTLDFAGGGNKKQKSLIKKMILEANLSNRVNLHGVLQKSELVKLYKEGGIFISTSRWEGFGLAIVEAMEFGLPIVSFDTEGAKSIIGSDNTYGVIIEKQNIDEMVDAILYIRKSKEHYSKLAKTSRNRASDYYPDKIGGTWQLLINRLVE